MLSVLLNSLRAIIAAVLYTLLTFGIMIIIIAIGIFRWIGYFPRWRRACTHGMQWVGYGWNAGNNLIFALTTRIQWDIQSVGKLDPKQSYFLMANHQTWADIPVVQKALPPGAGLSRYFIKKQLMRIPIAGWCLHMLNFPSMERFTKEQLKKHPELKGKDIETTRRSCEQFKEIPVTLISFVEGTRFMPEKHQRAASPYQHLLIPKAGGLSFAISAMTSYATQLIDMTIIYDRKCPTLWELFTGKITRISVKMELIPITPDLIGDYQNDMEFRKYFQAWLNERWRKKDKLISENTAPS